MTEEWQCMETVQLFCRDGDWEDHGLRLAWAKSYTISTNNPGVVVQTCGSSYTRL
jgi:hypothetical protein